MVASVSTVADLGPEARSVEVQCNLVPGLPKFMIVGLPDKAVAESRERVRAAMAAIGLAMPPEHTVLNLSSADLAKEGSYFDLPIALALLAAMGVTEAEALAEYVVVGELALDGRIASSPGDAARGAACGGRGEGADLSRGAGGGGGVGRDRRGAGGAQPDRTAQPFEGPATPWVAGAGRG